jgi:MFS transporter, ACS family, D-galactonate transporter
VTQGAQTSEDTARGWRPYHTLWGLLLLCWTMSAADRTLTGPVVTWMIEADAGILAGADKPFALGGLIGGLFFAGYMLTQWPGGYLGDRYGHRTIIVISMFWAALATVLTGIVSGLAIFIAARVITGLGEGAYYSNDRSLITAKTPLSKRSLGMGVAITGLAIGITIATLWAPDLIDWGISAFGQDEGWRMPFFVLGAITFAVAGVVWLNFRRHEPGLPYGRATLGMLAYAVPALAAVMAVYFIGDAAGLSNLAIAFLEVLLAVGLIGFIFARKADDVGTVVRRRELMLLNGASFAVLWNLWFFGFWSVAIVADAAGSSFGRSAMIAAFNAGAGILGFPAGGWLADYALRRGWGRKGMLLSFIAVQFVLTTAFGVYIAQGSPDPWVMAALLFSASLFFNALQPIGHALVADIAEPEHHGTAFGFYNLVGEMAAVLSPAVSGALRDATGEWTTAVYLDAAIIAMSFVLVLFVRERQTSRVFAEARSQPAVREPELAGRRN